MLRREHPKTGCGNTPEQEVYRNEFQRDGVRDIHLGYIKRELLQLVVLPRWKGRQYRGERTRYAVSELSPIMHHSNAELAMMWDRPLPAVRPGGRKMATVATVMQGRLTSAGQVLVAPQAGQKRSQQALHVDFAMPPFQTQQKSCMGRDIGNLKTTLWNRPSKLMIRNFGGDAVDICVGFLRKDVPAINYRIDMSNFVGDDPRAVLLRGEIPEVDQTIEVGLVEPGEAVVSLRKTTSYEAAIVEAGRPQVFRGYPPVTLTLDDPYHVHLFRQFNEMNRLMNDMTLDGALAPGDPDEWAPQALILFSTETAKRLTVLESFQPTPELIADLLLELRPGGSLVDCQEVETYVGARIEPGVYTEGILRKQLGSRFLLLVDLFLQQKAVTSEESGVAGVLLDARYVRSVKDYAHKEKGGVSWYWDFRKAWKYLDNGVLFCMPMRYRGENEMTIGGIRYIVDTPQRTQRSATHRKSKNNVNVISQLAAG